MRHPPWRIFVRAEALRSALPHSVNGCPKAAEEAGRPVAGRFPFLRLCPLATRDEWIFTRAPFCRPDGPNPGPGTPRGVHRRTAARMMPDAAGVPRCASPRARAGESSEKRRSRLLGE